MSENRALLTRGIHFLDEKVHFLNYPKRPATLSPYPKHDSYNDEYQFLALASLFFRQRLSCPYLYQFSRIITELKDFFKLTSLLYHKSPVKNRAF